MLSSIRYVALACLIALAPLAAGTGSATVQKSAPYFGNNDVLRVTDFDNLCLGGPHQFHAIDELGGVCFAPPPTATSVSIRINDKSGQPVGGFYSFSTTTGHYVTGHFCAATAAYIPADTYYLSVVIDGALMGPYDCNPQGMGAGIGTAGQVAVVFS